MDEEWILAPSRRAFIEQSLNEALELVCSNKGYFASQNGPSFEWDDLLKCCADVKISLLRLLETLRISEDEQSYDGYMSVIGVILRAVQNLVNLLKQFLDKSFTFSFSTRRQLRTLRVYFDQLKILLLMVDLTVIIANCTSGDLFVSEEKKPHVDALTIAAKVNTEVFFGEHFGFQYTSDVRYFLRLVFLACASVSAARTNGVTPPQPPSVLLSELWSPSPTGITATAVYSIDTTTASAVGAVGAVKSVGDQAASIDFVNAAKAMFHGAIFHILPEQAAAQFEVAKAQASVDFIRTFWNVTELPIVRAVSRVPQPSMSVARSFTIKPEPLDITATPTGHPVLVLHPPLLPPYVQAHEPTIPFISCFIVSLRPFSRPPSAPPTVTPPAQP
eukprot:CAMPEP_0184665030 /NCGR_PEP_ID=MMETSP0308-20130426/55378_1 /TAXON_ID=38269 /ORGANISM="Gloeochaete witrockiana, Strain SAG 46.84" /LENGTH=388 /DNA_ID=CAMNT_0027108773 /DNA_START=308 /DNA_END=1470 /DNA_ORIENTATION=+